MHAFDDGERRFIEPLGNRLMVEKYEATTSPTQIYDKGFDAVGDDLGERTCRRDGGSALYWPTWSG